MLRWGKAWLGAALWGFLLAGTIGCAEALSQWLRFDLLGGGSPAASPLRLLLPPFVLYGWWGLLWSGLLFPPAALLARWRPWPRRVAFSLATAGAVTAVLLVQLNYLLRQHVLPGWWTGHGGGLGALLLGMAGLSLLLLVRRPLRNLADRLAPRRSATLVFPLLIVIVSTSLWPDWRQEGRQLRTEQLVRAAEPAAGRAGAPNLVLITIDAWRRDHLSLSDPAGPPTPRLDALAREGILFTRAWSVSPWTLPSMATLMTGLPPQELGVDRYRPLPRQPVRLAEIAWTQGYRTAAFATNAFLTGWFGFDRGFEFFEHSLVLETLLPAGRSVLARELTRYADEKFEVDSAEIVIPKAMSWLRRRGADGPFFLWVHLMNPHLPYRWRRLPAEETPVRGRVPDAGRIPDTPEFAGRAFNRLADIREGRFVPDAAAREGLCTLYDREVQFADHWTGKLLQTLRDRGLWRNTLVVVLADHGEELFDHGGFEHGHSVLPEVTGVPLILRLPQDEAAGTQVEDPVTTLDLLPTLCRLLDWPVPAAAPGRPLWPREEARAVGPRAEPFLLENLLYEPQQRGVLAWPWLAVRCEGETGTSWFELDADPTAQTARAAPACGADVLAAADSLEARWRAGGRELRDAAASPGAWPPELARKLRALGY